jgi:hypothetical protein
MTAAGRERKELVTDIEQRLMDIDSKIDRLRVAVESIAVQNVRIMELDKRVDALWNRWDNYAGPQGVLDNVRNHQASCPRNQVRLMWVVLIPMGLTLLGMGITLLRMMGGA